MRRYLIVLMMTFVMFSASLSGCLGGDDDEGDDDEGDEDSNDNEDVEPTEQPDEENPEAGSRLRELFRSSSDNDISGVHHEEPEEEEDPEWARNEGQLGGNFYLNICQTRQIRTQRASRFFNGRDLGHSFWFFGR